MYLIKHEDFYLPFDSIISSRLSILVFLNSVGLLLRQDDQPRHLQDPVHPKLFRRKYRGLAVLRRSKKVTDFFTFLGSTILQLHLVNIIK